METIECKFCSKVISATATECDNCGYGTPYGVKLEEEKELKEAATKSIITLIDCPACHSEVSNQSVACPKCGQPINVPQPMKASTPSTFISLNRASRSRSGQTSAAPGYLIIFGVILAAVSAVAYLWATNYAGNFGNAMSAGLGSLIGRRDQTYDMAIMAIQFGPFGFFAGLIMLVVGLVLKNR